MGHKILMCAYVYGLQWTLGANYVLINHIEISQDWHEILSDFDGPSNHFEYFLSCFLKPP